MNRLSRKPISPTLRARFERGGCVFGIAYIHNETGRAVASTHPKAVEMHPVIGPDGSYITDWAIDPAMLRVLAYHGIFAPLCPRAYGEDEAGHAACIGQGKDGKWYGWSHRAMCGFGIGSEVKAGDLAFVPADREQAVLHEILSAPDGGVHKNKVVEARDDGLFVAYDVVQRGTGKVYHNELVRPWPETWGRGEWIAKTDEDARQMAIDFAAGVDG